MASRSVISYDAKNNGDWEVNMSSRVLEEARLKAQTLAAEAIQLEEAGRFREALAKLDRASPYVGMWDDPVFETGYYTSMATLYDKLGYSAEAARFVRMSAEARNRCQGYRTVEDILREYYDRLH